jgi:hypothetical protein
MALLLVSAILLAGKFFGATLRGPDFITAAALTAAVPPVIYMLSVLYEAAEKMILWQVGRRNGNDKDRGPMAR